MRLEFILSVRDILEHCFTMDMTSDFCRLKFTDMDIEMEDCSGIDMTQATLSGGSKKKVNKPLMERRRRARINQSLTELKSLVLDGMKKDPTRYSRLEKADILDMTVVHLRNLQRKAVAASSNEEESLERYKTGFQHCAEEISRYLSENQTVDDNLKKKILNHVNQHVDKLSVDALPKPTQVTTADGRPVASVSPMTSQNSQAVGLEGSPRVVFGSVQLVLNGANNAQRLRMILPKQSPDASTAARPVTPSSDDDRTGLPSASDVTHGSPTHTDNTGSSLDGSLEESDEDNQVPVQINPVPDLPGEQNLPLNLSAAARRQVPVQSDNMWRPW